jgi:hypothetical protein
MGSGNVGFQTPGLSSANEGFAKIKKNSINKK